jgi:RNA polymerase sigma factor (TIGR02999 family)
MIPSSPHEITQLLRAWSAGDQEALEKLIPLVEAELRRLAQRNLRRWSQGHVLQTTALVNEAYIRLIDGKQVDWKGRTHFFAVSATIMRHILVDIFRRRPRIDGQREARQVELDEALVISTERGPDLVALDDALKALAKIDPRKSRIVELKFFGGLTSEEIAEELKLSPRTVKSEWKVAKAWLYRELSRQ